MRILMLGTGGFAVPTFRALLDSPHDVLGLVTQPARDTRPGRAAPLSPMRAGAQRADIGIHDPPSINSPEGVGLLRGFGADLLVVCDYGQILKPDALAATKHGGINLHGSLLPKYRGAAPVNWAILRGDSQTGVTVIHMTPRLDAGPILAHRQTVIDPEEDALALEARLADLGVGAVLESIEVLQQWDGVTPIGERQDPAQATRAPRLKKSDARIDWNWPAETIRNRVRGLVPWPGTYTEWSTDRSERQRLIVRRVARADTPPSTAATAAAAPGAIMTAGADQLSVMCGDGQAIALVEVQPAGKKPMSAAEFLRGYRVREGQRFE